MVLFSNSILLQFGERAGAAGPREVTLPSAYTHFYSISAINRDTKNPNASCVKLLASNQSLTSFSGIAVYTTLDGSGYSSAIWLWITIGY